MTSRLDPVAIARRLKQALEEGNVSLGELSERLQALGAEYTVSTIQRYIAGTTQPSGLWIAAAAATLKVEEKWLLWGEEPMARFPLTHAGLHDAGRRLDEQLISVAPVYFTRPDRLRFGYLVRDASRSLELEKAESRALVLEMVAAPIAAIVARLEPAAPAASAEEWLQKFVTTGQLSPAFFQVPHALEYVTFALNAIARAIPRDPPKVVASMRGLAQAANARRPRQLDINPKRDGLALTKRDAVKARNPRKPRTSK